MELSSMAHSRGSTSGGEAIGNEIKAFHDPAAIELNVKPILDIVEDISYRATPAVAGTVKRAHTQVDRLDETTLHPSIDQLIEYLSVTINRICCEITDGLSNGEDAHSTTLAVAKIVKSYSWDAKVVLALAAFAMTYGELLLVVQVYATNADAKRFAVLKQLPQFLARADVLKPTFDALAFLIKAMLQVAKCIVQFKELPSRYIRPEDPELSSANSDIPSAVYWTIRSTVASASEIIGLVGMGHEFISSTKEPWVLSSLAHHINGIHSDLMEKLERCHQHISERKNLEAYQTLVGLFDASHIDNIKILKALIYAKNDPLPLWNGTTKQKVSLDLMRRRNVLLLISDLEIPHEELYVLQAIYDESREHPTRVESQYDVIWLPIVDRSIPFDETKKQQFQSLQAMMPWYSVDQYPSMIEPVVIRYIKEVWGFKKKPLIVALDPQGKVVNPNAMQMMFIWGSLAYPFTKMREEALWNEQTWTIELLADSIEPAILDWLNEGKYICFYGGEDIEWIRKFTNTAKAVALAANIKLEMLYVGKSNPRERVRKYITIIQQENLSHVLPDVLLIWFFWARLESMLLSKVQLGATAENDHILQEILTILSYDGADVGWAMIGRGSDELARAKAETILKCLEEFVEWEALAAEKGFVPALNDRIRSPNTEFHCNRLIIPANAGSVPEKVVCGDCGKPMETYIMYRCCID